MRYTIKCSPKRFINVNLSLGWDLNFLSHFISSITSMLTLEMTGKWMLVSMLILPDWNRNFKNMEIRTQNVYETSMEKGHLFTMRLESCRRWPKSSLDDSKDSILADTSNQDIHDLSLKCIFWIQIFYLNTCDTRTQLEPSYAELVMSVRTEHTYLVHETIYLQKQKLLIAVVGMANFKDGEFAVFKLNTERIKAGEVKLHCFPIKFMLDDKLCESTIYEIQVVHLTSRNLLLRIHMFFVMLKLALLWSKIFCYPTRPLNPAARNHSSSEMECLVIVHYSLFSSPFPWDRFYCYNALRFKGHLRKLILYSMR